MIRTDVLTKDEAIQILRSNSGSRKIKEDFMAANGYPAYTTQVGMEIAIFWKK